MEEKAVPNLDSFFIVAYSLLNSSLKIFTENFLLFIGKLNCRMYF